MESPVKALESAVAHHLDELSPHERARLTMLTSLRRVGVACVFVGAPAGAFRLVQLMPPLLVFVAAAAIVVVGVGASLNQRARIAIARHALKAVERGRQSTSVGGAATSVSAGSFVLPALGGAPSAALGVPKKRQAPSRPKPVDRDAPDFDDAA